MKPHLPDKCTSRRLDENEKNVKAMIHFLANPTAKNVIVFRSDNGTEFKNEELKTFF
jgi:hypothetical protein